MTETALPTHGLYIDNASRDGGGAPLDVLDPSTGELLTQIRTASIDEVRTAAESARRASEEWAGTAPAVRGKLLARCAEAILESADELAEVSIRDCGLPRSLARRDVETAARYFEYYAGLADKTHGDTIPLGPEFLAYTVREPWGVCGIVLPFNFALQLAARDIAPALAVGNTVVAKPAEQAPLPALALAETCRRAGLPPGVLNVVTGGGDVGAALIADPRVAHVTFTGSQGTGRRVMQACAELLKPSTIELGGKSPHVLFEDGPVDAMVTSIVATSFRSAGQACSAGTRLLVQHDLHDAAVERLAGAVATLRVGRATDNPDVGPLVSRQQQETVLEAIETGVSDGARAVVGGGAPSAPETRNGFFVEPTVLTDVEPTAAVACEEIFGPVVSVLPFADEHEAIRLANATDYGLVAGVWTRDVGRAHRVARALEAGQVFVNNYGVGGGVELPFGGYKRSGIGRVKGQVAVLEYTQAKTVCVAL